MSRYTRRQFLHTGLAGGAFVLTACSGGSPGGSTGTTGALVPTTAKRNPRDLPDIEGGEVVTGASAIPSRFNERPEFAAMVAAGTLPPVAERIGQQPLVIRPLHATGTYGGTLRRGYLGVVDRQNAARFCAGPDSLLYWDSHQENVVPNIAAGFEMSEDFTELLLHLRDGMRWSDGQPFTADDIVFWRTEINLNKELASPSAALRVGGQDVAVEKVDDLTVRFRSPAPHPLLPRLLAGWSDVGGQAANGNLGGGGFAPQHYLTQFHPAHISQAEVDALAAAAGYDSWVTFFNSRNTWELNPELPVVTPWVVTRPINDPPWQFFANPYSIWVDTDGNQLPYIGDITMDLSESLDVITLRATSGEFDFQDRHLEVRQLPVLLDSQERGGYTLHQTPGESMDCTLRPNLAYDGDPVLAELIRTVEFRRALSLAIDRDQINEAFFVGTSVPSASLVPDESPYFPGEEWRTKWATLDLDQANQLLDGLGLTVDGSGRRQRPDGGSIRLECLASSSFADFAGIGEMLVGQWAQLGIDLRVEVVDGTLATERIQANQVMIMAGALTTGDPFLLSEGFLPTSTRGLAGAIGVPYVQWFSSGGTEGVEPPASLRLAEGMALYERGLQAPDDERVEIGKELYRLHADQVWTMGICGFGLSLYGMFLAQNGLGNIPARIISSPHQKTPSNALPMTFYYE